MIILPAIKETTRDYEALEKKIRDLFKSELYLPILRELDCGSGRVLNDKRVPGLQDALLKGQVTFSRGVFSGRFNSEITKQLRAMGATFDRATGTYRLLSKDLPLEVRHSVALSEARFREKIEKIDSKLGQVVSDVALGRGIVEKLKTDYLFDRAIWRVEKEFQKNVRNITVTPALTPAQRKRIASEWGENMQLWVKDFTEKEVKELRQKMMQTVFSGDRYGSAVKTIQDSYGVTERKAKFLARQETSLLMTKFKQTRYQGAGIEYYKWQCVSGTKQHPVRPLHKKNEGKVWRWDEPPTVDEAGNRKNPGQDYNCRCTARALVGYSGPTGVKSPR
jgi:SPP1 gp7 family putative phage head morphogenesis protein